MLMPNSHSETQNQNKNHFSQEQLSSAYETVYGQNPQQGISNPQMRPPKPPYTFKPYDRLLGILTFALGFIFWEWGILFEYPRSSLGTFIFFNAAIIIGLVFMNNHGIVQTKKSLIWLALTVAATAPFLLFARLDIDFFLIYFVITLYLIWVAYSCKTEVSDKLSGFIISDMLNQLVIVPFTHFGLAFQSIFSKDKSREGNRRVLAAIIGIIISIPILVLIISLLISADDGFSNLADKIPDYFDANKILGYVLSTVLGIPVACYIFGSLAGNADTRPSTMNATKEGTEALLAKVHKIPNPSIYAPLVIFNILYLVFFIAMGTYLFSAFRGTLPEIYTYAEYARKGFFELCGVSAINLLIIMFVYCFAKRQPKEYPKVLRFLTAFLSVMTIFLIATAMSKMLLYIGAYGLSRLRVYTLWFMLLLLATFIVVVIWHIKPFNAGKPLVIAVVAMILILFFSNSDGLIAKYNIDQYMKGNLEKVDVEMMEWMSPAVIPHLEQLEKNAPDANTRIAARHAISALNEHQQLLIDSDDHKFYTWNLQSARIFD